MSFIITADWHLTDKPADEYRWGVFAALQKAIKDTDADVVFICGDLTDNKDRHSAVLVNRLIHELTELSKLHVSVVIMMGNHDMPLRGTPFWRFLDYIPKVRFFDEPFAWYPDLLLLPYANKPIERWRGIQFRKYKCALMHQTVKGAVGEHGHVLDGHNVPAFPRGLKVYSGDTHVPQTIGQIEYIGAPHPIKFGDDYPCRLLSIDLTSYKIDRIITLDPPKKIVANITSVDDLQTIGLRNGDQLRVNFTIDASKVEQWSIDQKQLIDWATDNGVSLVSTEAIVAPQIGSAGTIDTTEETPEQVLQQFAAAEGIDEDLLSIGQYFLKEVQS